MKAKKGGLLRDRTRAGTAVCGRPSSPSNPSSLRIGRGSYYFVSAT